MTDELLVTTASFVDALRAQDAKAYVKLTAAYVPDVYRWFRRCGAQPADAHDACQETVIAVCRSIDSFQPDGQARSFRRWLWTIAGNALRQVYRRRNRQLNAVEDSDKIVDSIQTLPGARPGDSPVSERIHLLRRTMDIIRWDFSPTTWQAFERLCLGNESPSVVGAELYGFDAQGRPKATAAIQAKNRVLKRIEETFCWLEEHG